MDGEIQIIPYEGITIICRKHRESLKPNIYVNTKFLSIGETIRGNIVITCKENEGFKSLDKTQTIKYIAFLRNASFHYDNASKNSKIIENKNFKTSTNDYTNTNIDKFKNNDNILQMILAIQTVILKFIKNNKN